MGSAGRGLVAPITVAVLFVATVVGSWVLVFEITGQRPFIWFGTISTLALHLGIIVFWTLLAAIVWWVAGRSLTRESREAKQETIYRMVLICSSFFVFVLGFVVSEEWSNVNAVQADVSSGMGALESATYQAEALPQPERDRVVSSLTDLGLSTYCQELPSLEATGNGSPETAAALRKVFRTLNGLPPGLQDESVVGDLFEKAGEMAMSRRLVLAGAASGLPAVILVSIIVVGCILLVLFTIQSTRSQRTHLMMTIGLIVLLSFGTAMMLSLARPFAGAATMDEAFDRASSPSLTACSRLPD